MSDTRFTLIGVGLIFVGFIILGVVGPLFFDSTVEAKEFGDCYEYFDDKPPVEISCDAVLQYKIALFALVVGFIAAGIYALIRGVRGNWDQKVRSEDMLGPGHGTNDADSDDTKT